MKTVICTYSKKDLRNLTKPFAIRVGNKILVVRAIKPEIVTPTNARIQERIDLSYNKPAEILKRAKANRRGGAIILNC